MIIFFEESRSNVVWVIWGMLCLRSCKFYYFGMVEPMFCEIFLGSFPGLFVDPSALLGSFGLLLLFWISVFWDSLDLMLLSLLVERHYVCILNILVTVVIPNCWTGVAGGYLPFSVFGLFGCGMLLGLLFAGSGWCVFWVLAGCHVSACLAFWGGLFGGFVDLRCLVFVPKMTSWTNLSLFVFFCNLLCFGLTFFL